MEPIYNGQIGVSAFCPLWRGLLDEGLICIITLVQICASVTCPLHVCYWESAFQCIKKIKKISIEIKRM